MPDLPSISSGGSVCITVTSSVHGFSRAARHVDVVLLRDSAKIGPTLLLHRCPGTVRDGAKRRDTMGDKGGKKDKEKGQKQNSAKHQQMDKAKQDKQPKKKLG